MKGLTALMYAATQAADETVAFLLSKGASPDLMDSHGLTALSFAIQSSCSSTIALLVPVTKKGLEPAVAAIADNQSEITPEVEKLLRRAALDQDALKTGVEYAAQHGAARMLKILTESWTKNTISPSYANQLMEMALKSDNAETVQVILNLVHNVSPGKHLLGLDKRESRCDQALWFW